MKLPVIVTDSTEIRRACDGARLQGQRVGLVATMGALHEGHQALVRAARAQNDLVVGTIFVNPTQFAPGEDYERYPRDLERDRSVFGVDLLFAPEPGSMYLAGEATRVRVDALAKHLCGPFRPLHFEGVATVVAKLLGIVGPCNAFFGKKDYQQLAIVRRMVADLFLPVEVSGVPTVRQSDGLAMSSRNAYLTAEDRVRASETCRGLRASMSLFESGERRCGVLREATAQRVERVATSVDYVSLADPDTLEPLREESRVGERALLAVACRLGSTRLIDNVVLGEDTLPG